MEQKRFVAIWSNADNTCKRVFECKSITDQEHKKLLDESLKSISREQKDEHTKDHMFGALSKKVWNHDYAIAKAIYDNYVDRGVFEENEEFQKAFYDEIFNGIELDFDKTPIEFQQIVKFLRGE